MSDSYILAHDIGTSAIKSVLMNQAAAIVASAQTPNATLSAPDGKAEQQPQALWEGVCRNTRALVAQYPQMMRQIAGIGLSGHMLGCLPVDRDGQALHNILIHADTRATRECEQIDAAIGRDAIYATTGNILDPRSSLPKILWFKQRHPDVYATTAKFLQSKDYIAGCLTGSFDSTDYSDASHGQLLNLEKRTYIADMLRAVQLDAEKLPRLYTSSDIVGRVSDRVAAELGLTAGIPVVAGGGDGSCASIGARAVREGDTYACLGSSAWIASVSKTPVIDPQQRYFMIMGLDGESFGVFGTMQSSGTSISWAKEAFGLDDYETINQAVLRHSPTNPALIFLPYLEGERSPIFDPQARGVFFGLSTAHARADMVAAVVEGVAFALKSILESLRERLAIQRLNVIGGGAQLAAMPQLLADVFGLEVATLSTAAKDATSLGAAINAAVGVGMFRDFEDGVQAISTKDTYAATPEKTPAYDSLFATYMALYPCLKSVFPDLRVSLVE